MCWWRRKIREVLYRFSFRGFGSCGSRAAFSFHTVTVPRFRSTLVQRRGTRSLLPIDTICNPGNNNGAGLLRTFFYLVGLIIGPVRTLRGGQRPVVFRRNDDITPFVLSRDSTGRPAVFRIFFHMNRGRCRCCVTLGRRVIFRSLL